ncbi:MAG: hypothetical protein GFH27_549287n101 [Chloroflexi bacterium AL-W]|nr:hypothetical protein [Chloroflexi bacterium AL-N1]NOK66375.1 hypothetical protein [Chloroflexi bacterium AL-N10]NOK71763.1 hypothetical protein [Chloroflexi bacterium AL-N5]NOK81020.1 hypothetical protein [Chloroflexi bacterium AL-W]NOK89293.1 hypothetical protein [Chloroflexi bacterium AL-N15]
MQNKSLHDIALRYCVDDLPGASIPHARLQKILNALQSGKRLTQTSLVFLRQRSLHALHRFAIGELPYDSFYELTLAEQAMRIQAETSARQTHATEKQIREAAREEKRQLAYVHATAARLARESDPAYQAKIKKQELRAKYGIRTFVKRQYLTRLMNILKRVDADQRLDEGDFVWLSTVGKDYFTNELRIAYHRLEADFLTSEFHKTRDPWNAINASSHYRKCNRAHDADDLLSQINLERQLPKLQAALCTTQRGTAPWGASPCAPTQGLSPLHAARGNLHGNRTVRPRQSVVRQSYRTWCNGG